MSVSKTKKANKNISKGPIDFILLVVVLIMLALGIIMVMSASSPTSIAETGNSYKYVKVQARNAILGLVLMYFVSKIDYSIYKNFYKIIYIGVLILLLSVIVVGAGSGRSNTLGRFRIY